MASTTQLAHVDASLPGNKHFGVKAGPPKQKKQHTGKKRKAALLERGRFWAEIQRHKVIEQVFAKYDVSKTGFLDKNECKKFLQDAAKGQQPTDEEVTFVIQSVHVSSNRDGKGITMSEMSIALDIWRTWEQTKPEMQNYMHKYDTNESGKLELDQLKSLLTDLNEGIPPSDEEVKWVMDVSDGKVEGVEKTGGVNITELHGAIVLWYTHVEHDDESGGSGTGQVAVNAESQCCSVS